MNSKVRLSKSELRKEIEKATGEYTAQDLFSDGSMKEILESIIIGTCSKMDVHPTLSVICDETSDLTACTSGRIVMQNTLGPLIRELPTNWEKYIANVGHTVHEIGHILFTDFKEGNKCRECWEMGTLSTATSSMQQKPIKDKFKDKPLAMKIYAQMMTNLQNTLEDAYVENLLNIVFAGVATQGLALVNKEMIKKIKSKKDIVEDIVSKQLPPFIIADSLLLAKHVCHKELEPGELTEEEKEILENVEMVIQTADKEISELLWEKNGTRRAELMDSIYLKFLPLFPVEMINDADADSGSGNDPNPSKGEKSSSGEGEKAEGQESSGLQSSAGSTKADNSNSEEQSMSNVSSEAGNNDSSSADSKTSEGNDEKEEKSGEDISKEEAERMSDEISARNSQIGKSENIDPNSTLSNQANSYVDTGSESKKKGEENRTLSENAGEVNGNLALEKAIKETVKNNIMGKDEEAHENALKAEVQQMFDDKSRDITVGRARFRGYALARPKPCSKAIYNSEFAGVRASAQNLLRKINNIMREREVESVASGFMMGQRFNAKDIVNRDGKYFSRQIIPDGKVTTAFGVLIDESASMCGENELCARKAAILLEYVLRNLGVANIIVGHTEFYDEVWLKCYSDFDTRDGKDCYRLANISAISGNIDGAAITYIGEKLLKRPEDKKVLIVISDGLPAGCSFYSKSDEEDTKLAAEHYRKKGIEVFGAIVDNVEPVSRLYGKDYCFDCTSPGELEKQFIKLIKKYVLMKK